MYLIVLFALSGTTPPPMKNSLSSDQNRNKPESSVGEMEGPPTSNRYMVSSAAGLNFIKTCLADKRDAISSGWRVVEVGGS